MRNCRPYVLALIFSLFSGFALSGQSLPTVAAYSLTSNSVAENVTATVNDLVFSFIHEIRTYRIVDMRADSLPADLRVPDGTDYLFYGTLTSFPDGIKLELVLKGGPFAVTRIISRVYDNSNRILLESRMLVRDLFDQSVSLPDPDASLVTGDSSSEANSTNGGHSTNGGDSVSANPPVNTGTISPNTGGDKLGPVTNIDALAGSWRGDDDIEKVMILRGGRGVAILSSGVSIPLELFLSSGDLVIRQKGNPNPRQFVDLPDPVAKQAAVIAPPLEWRFLVTGDLQQLSGTKKTVIVKNDGVNIISMDTSMVGTVWKRD